MPKNAIKKKIKYSASEKIFYTITYTIITLLMLVVLYPLIYVVACSFSSPNAVITGKVILWPVDFSLVGYQEVFKDSSVWIGYKNTILYTVVGTSINVAMTLICAYPLSRKGLPHKGFFTFLFSFTMMFSGGMIPSYLLMRDLHILNSFWVMVLPGAMAVYQMVIVRTFFQTNLPGELIEATQVDGCNDIRFFFQFALPLSKAVIAVIALQYAIGHWNDYFNAFLYLSSESKYPLQIYLRKILTMAQVAANAAEDDELASALVGLSELLRYALIVVATVPILCVYPFIQKYFVQGVMVGSLKG